MWHKASVKLHFALESSLERSYGEYEHTAGSPAAETHLLLDFRNVLLVGALQIVDLIADVLKRTTAVQED